MNKQPPRDNASDNGTDFEDLADLASPGLLREFIDFLKYNKKWWLLPIVLVVLVLGLFVVLTASPLAPFIYSLF